MHKKLIGCLLLATNITIPVHASHWNYSPIFENIEHDFIEHFATQVLYSHDIDPQTQFNEPTTDEWITGITMIVAGILLLRYPPPVRTVGIAIIEYSIGYIGEEYLKDIVHYLRTNNIVDPSVIEEIKKPS